MATRRFTNNEGHVLVIPNQHFENIFDLPLELGAEIHVFSRTIALAMKTTYHCDGIFNSAAKRTRWGTAYLALSSACDPAL